MNVQREADVRLERLQVVKPPGTQARGITRHREGPRKPLAQRDVARMFGEAGWRDEVARVVQIVGCDGLHCGNGVDGASQEIGDLPIGQSSRLEIKPAKALL